MYDKEHVALVQKFAGMIMDMIRGDARLHDSDKKNGRDSKTLEEKTAHKLENRHHWLSFFPNDMNLIDLIMVVVDSAAGIQQYDSDTVRIPVREDLVDNPYLTDWIYNTLVSLFPDRELDLQLVPEDKGLVKQAAKMRKLPR